MVFTLYDKTILSIVWVAPRFALVARLSNYDISVVTASAEDIYVAIMLE